MTGLREIGTFYDPEEAQVALGYIRAHGIEAVLPDFNMLSQNPTHRIALGGFRMMVPEIQADEAKSLLDKKRKQPITIETSCPNCGANDFRRVKAWWFPAVFFVTMGAFVPFATNSRYLECNACKIRVSRNLGAQAQTQ